MNLSIGILEFLSSIFKTRVRSLLLEASPRRPKLVFIDIIHKIYHIDPVPAFLQLVELSPTFAHQLLYKETKHESGKQAANGVRKCKRRGISTEAFLRSCISLSFDSEVVTWV